MHQPADRHLLFGLLALQAGLIRQDQLVAAFHAWTSDKSRPIDDHLLALGHLNEAQRALMNALADLHVRGHDGNAEQSLASIQISHATRVQLATVADPDLDASLASVGQADTDADPDRTGTFHVGLATSAGQRFRVLRPHAKGGLGAVFVAFDSELHREVALKQILDHHADNPQLRSRFLVEAEITGGLEHPGIVPVYGLGTYGDGRPFYAMRFIRGDSLREAIDTYHKEKKSRSDRSLEFRRLLRKSTDVCNAIDYAHSRGVLHRDIKPGNVIVGKHGETLVVDWGLAKALGKSVDDSPERTLIPTTGERSSETLPGQTLGTPAYMSPEQARGEINQLGPRSDVYSLGATLYCLLTGQAPFQGKAGAVLKAVEVGHFRKPRERDNSIDPALEAIVLKAMAKDPANRYGSAREMAEEIDRWLADERVEAYREPWTRSLQRWLSRHRTGVTGLAAAGIMALAGLGAVSVVQTKANNDLKASNTALDLQRQRAEANEEQAINAVKRFEDAVINNAELKNNPELKTLRATLLKEPLAFFGQLRERLQANNDTQPESLAKLAGVAFDHAKLTYEIGDKTDAIRALRVSLDIYERLVCDHPTVIKYQASLAGSHSDLGNLLSDTGRADEAGTAYQRAIEVQERLVRDHPTVIKYQADLANSHNNLGVLLRDTGHADEARTAYQRALEVRERLVRDHPTVTKYQADLAASHNNLGVLLCDTGHADEARTAYQRAIDTYERLVRDYPTVTEFQADLARIHNNLGNLLSDSGHADEARTAYQRAIEVRERLVREQPTVTMYQAGLAVSHINLGNLLRNTGHADEARTACQRAIDIQERLVRDHPTVTEFLANLARSHDCLGILLSDTGHLDEARTAYQRAIDIWKRLARDHPEVPDHASDLSDALSNLAGIDLAASQFAVARERLLEAIAWQKRALEANPRNPQYRRFYQSHLDNLIQAERGLGHEDEAVRIERELAEFRLNDPTFAAVDARLQAVVGGEAPHDGAERLQLGQRAYDLKRYALAAKLWGEALDSDPKLAGDRQAQHPYHAACAASLAADGQGIGPPGDDAEKARLRGRALQWLRGEREIWSKLVASGPPQARPVILQVLQHWQADPDLASVREADSLAKLPETERTDWQRLWDEVATLLKRCSEP